MTYKWAPYKYVHLWSMDFRASGLMESELWILGGSTEKTKQILAFLFKTAAKITLGCQIVYFNLATCGDMLFISRQSSL